jgi:hypothetical protein
MVFLKFATVTEGTILMLFVFKADSRHCVKEALTS